MDGDGFSFCEFYSLLCLVSLWVKQTELDAIWSLFPWCLEEQIRHSICTVTNLQFYSRWGHRRSCCWSTLWGSIGFLLAHTLPEEREELHNRYEHWSSIRVCTFTSLINSHKNKRSNDVLPAQLLESAQWKSAAVFHLQSWYRTARIHFSKQQIKTQQ